MTAPAPSAESPTSVSDARDLRVRTTPFGSIAGLLAGQIVGGAIVGWFAVQAFAETGLRAAFAATAVCLVGSIAGFLLSVRFTGLKSVIGMLLGLSVRMGVAMAAMAFAVGQQLFGTGFPECLVANYLISLVLDTLFAVRMLKQPIRT